jgi:hypothetical protein
MEKNPVDFSVPMLVFGHKLLILRSFSLDFKKKFLHTFGPFGFQPILQQGKLLISVQAFAVEEFGLNDLASL